MTRKGGYDSMYTVNRKSNPMKKHVAAIRKRIKAERRWKTAWMNKKMTLVNVLMLRGVAKDLANKSVGLGRAIFEDDKKEV